MSKIVNCNQLLKASVTTTFQASHSYPSILCNISELAVLHAIELRVRFGRKDQSPVLLLYITFIVARHTYWPLYYYYHVQPSSAAFSTDICYFCLRWSEVMSIVDVMPDGARSIIRSIIWILFQHASSECSRWSQRCSEIVDTLWGNSVVLVLSCPWFYRSIYQILPQVYCIRVPPQKYRHRLSSQQGAIHFQRFRNTLAAANEQ